MDKDVEKNDIYPFHKKKQQNRYINCQNGTIDLRTGKLLPHKREDMITKLISFNYDTDADCEAWEEHLYKIMDGNEALISFLQKAFGYSLTGDTSERVIFIEWGTANITPNLWRYSNSSSEYARYPDTPTL